MPKIAVLFSAVAPEAAAPVADSPSPVPVPVSPSAPLASRADNACVAKSAAQTLAQAGHEVVLVGAWDRVPVEQLHDVDAVLNLCEMLADDSSREAEAAQQLADAGIPFSGNTPEVLRLCQRKELCRQALVDAGVPVPPGCVLTRVPDVWPAELPSPCIVKPAHEDASEGIDANQIARDLPGLQRAVRRIVEGMGEPAVCEAFIDGRELTASIIGDPVEVLPLGEIDFSGMPEGCPNIVCYAAKWDPESPQYQKTPSVDCKLDAATTARVKKIARMTAKALGIRDVCRLDLRLDARGGLYVIDVNPNCDMGEQSGFPKAGYRAGMRYEDVLHRVLARALSERRTERVARTG